MLEIKFEKENNRAVAYDEKKEIGVCEFVESENIWNITHTFVEATYQGQGIARKLVECIIENSKKYSQKLIADCSYAKKVIEK